MTRLPEPLEVIRHDPYSISVVLEVDETLPFFPGHFPGQPVLPGVVMLDWVASLAERYLPLRIEFARLEAVKFKQMVRPVQKIRVDIQFKADSGKLVYRLTSDSAEHSSGRICHARLLAQGS
ncbi:MAG TPA: hypothetical protein VIN71_08825 [Pseudomonadales bacterium]